MILGTLFALEAFGPRVLASWLSTAEALMGAPHLGRLSPAGLWPVVADTTWNAAVSLLLILLLVMALAVLANLAQVGFLVVPRRLALRLDAVSPIGNLARIFSGRSLCGAAAGLMKLAAVAGAAWLAVRREIPALVMLQTLPIHEAVAAGGAIVMSVGLKLAIVLLALGLLDYALARWRWEQDLRLTPQEAREESRRMEGDPQMRTRRRQVARQCAPANRDDNPSCALIVERAPPPVAPRHQV
jgi:flagellar biosynthetic protein FlhB